MSLELRPMSIREASAYVSRWHRHLDPPSGALFALAAWRSAQLEPAGVLIVGRPVGRGLQDGRTCEVLRCATDESRNVPSFLYGAAKRAAKALGYLRCVTSTLARESGATMRAIEAVPTGQVRGRSWNTPKRPRKDRTAAQREPKQRWTLFDDRPNAKGEAP